MNINIKATQVDLTPALREYIEEKMESIEKLVTRWDATGTVEAHIQVARTSRHHLKGEVFLAEIDLRLPHEKLHAEAIDADMRAAIDQMKDMLHRDLERFKDREVSDRRRRQKGEV